MLDACRLSESLIEIMVAEVLLNADNRVEGRGSIALRSPVSLLARLAYALTTTLRMADPADAVRMGAGGIHAGARHGKGQVQPPPQ